MTDTFKNTVVLITGANGFIGSHLARKLVLLGARVKAFVDPSTSLWRIHPLRKKLDIYPVDITNSLKIDELIKKIKPRKIYHLAAYLDTSRSPEVINKMIDVNLKGTINMLCALKNSAHKFDCFINTDTCEAYGGNDVPFLETQREQPVSAYSGSKVCATYFCQMMNRAQGMPIVILRPSLVYGPYQTNGMLIPSLISKCIANEEFHMTQGEQSREFVYISDIVSGYLKASITPRAIGEIINLGSGQEYKVKDVVNLIVKITKTRIIPKVGRLSYRAAELMHFYCSNLKAKELLDWEPIVPLDQGLFKTVQWYKSYFKKLKIRKDVYK